MPVVGLNHAVLYVRDVERTAKFYIDLLGFGVRHQVPKRAVFLHAPGSINDHDLAVFAVGDDAAASNAGLQAVGLYHLGWEVDTLEELQRLQTVLDEAGALVGSSDHGASKSLYAKDPDGLEFEVAWMVPLADYPGLNGSGRSPLDITGEIIRYGATTLSNCFAVRRRSN